MRTRSALHLLLSLLWLAQGVLAPSFAAQAMQRAAVHEAAGSQQLPPCHRAAAEKSQRAATGTTDCCSPGEPCLHGVDGCPMMSLGSAAALAPAVPLLESAARAELRSAPAVRDAGPPDPQTLLRPPSPLHA